MRAPSAAPAFPPLVSGQPTAESLKRTLLSPLQWLGELGLFSARLVRSALAPPYAGRELIRQLDEVGSKSALLVAIAGAAIGVVLSLETRTSLLRFGAKSFLPAVVVLSLIRETGPIITARAISVLGSSAPPSSGLPSLKLRQNIEWVEKETIRRALESARGIKKDAAELMGISQRALSYYLAKYRLD